ncbi:homoserine kinase [Peribacillus alkalitolerans]|uniref:homoserine kinase n=1 Tax=Peribacillus alkalitolerans TaxID=1550385 RepID=UPI0013D37F19|nr:homoserine kinase [Peribacillus alkalitolerans]
MNDGKMFSIHVPASTANLGPGFDSIGLALNLYLSVDVYESEHYQVIPMTEDLEEFPRDDQNYIFLVAKKISSKFGKTLPACTLKVSNEIPLTRGLGSSASAIVAGVELADVLCGLGLTKEEKAHLASDMEGHPDNAGASVLGGLVVGVQLNEETNLMALPLDGVDIVALIPKYELLTTHSRAVLPSVFSYDEGVKASAIANTFLAALLTKNYTLAGKMMSEDRFHQPYRRMLVPHLGVAEKVALEAGAFGVALSGAGPTIVAFCGIGEADAVFHALQAQFPEDRVMKLQVDHDGSVTIPIAKIIKS